MAIGFIPIILLAIFIAIAVSIVFSSIHFPRYYGNNLKSKKIWPRRPTADKDSCLKEKKAP